MVCVRSGRDEAVSRVVERGRERGRLPRIVARGGKLPDRRVLTVGTGIVTSLGRVRPWRRASCVAGVLAVLAGAACRQAGTPSTRQAAALRLMPAPSTLAGAPPGLADRLAASPLALFRFVNQAWTREVCEAFANDLRSVPSVRLHGDAHIEQYALTSDARGLDDFDDSARGPAAVDMVRFLGSLQLAARERGWEASLPELTDAFLVGYRRGLENPAYLPPDPAVIVRLRAKGVPSQEEFLAWADSLMQPLSDEDLARVDAARGRLQAYATQIDPAFTPAFMTIKRIGWLHLGIGSALARKLLFHVEGPTSGLDDDVVLEAKEVSLLPQDSCLIVPSHAEVFRVVEGLGQIGRIEHRLVVALPVLPDAPADARGGWWVRTWERSYRELEVGDLASAGELIEVAHDAGAQLGATNLADAPRRQGGQARMVELEGLGRLEPRIRTVAGELTLALLDAWQRVRAHSPTR